MRLTWKDGVATVFMAGITAIYIAFVNGAGWPLVASARGTAAAILILGAVGGCAFGAASDIAGRQKAPNGLLITLSGLLGLTVLTAGIYALVTASTQAVALAFAATLAVWLTATLRHAFVTPTPPASGRDTHEVIDPDRTTFR